MGGPGPPSGPALTLPRLAGRGSGKRRTIVISRRALLRAAPLLLVIALAGAGAAGCSNSNGRQLAPTSTTSPNLTVNNQSNNTLNVYLDGGQIGQVPPNQTGNFQVLSGTYTVEVRETGHTSYYSFGDLTFGFNTHSVTYRP